MKLYAPNYYKKFLCIADRCRHTCCAGWEIDIDEVTLQKYGELTRGYGQEIQKSIDFEGVPHFRLCKGERCPHLNEEGLCKIILSLGGDYLCDICREHPRFYHDTVRGKEVGLGMACEEACRLILNSDDYDQMIEIEEVDDNDCSEFDSISLREKLYAILKDESVPYRERLDLICREYGISLTARTDEEWKEILASFEYLDNTHRDLFSQYTSAFGTPHELEKSLERALAYFVYRHCSDACDENEFRSALGFSLFCERLLASIAKNRTDYSIVDIACIVSEEIEYSESNTETIKLDFLFCN